MFAPGTNMTGDLGVALKQIFQLHFNTIHSGKDTGKQWYCYNRIEL